MMVSTRILSLIEEFRQNAANLSSFVAYARETWDDVNYERIAETTADYIFHETESACSTMQTDANVVYRDMMTIQTIINEI